MYDVNLISLTLCEMWDKDLSHSSLQKFCEDYYNINQNWQITNPKKETNNLSKGTQL